MVLARASQGRRDKATDAVDRNNRTTLEEMHRSVPTALLDPPTRALLETLGDRGSRNRTPGAWRPDHILTRPERNRLREGARGINVYDIGWRRNLRSVLVGEDALPPTTWRGSLDEVLGAMWPLSRPKTRSVAKRVASCTDFLQTVWRGPLLHARPIVAAAAQDAHVGAATRSRARC